MEQADGIEIIRDVVPDLDARIDNYTVDTSEVDDELMALFIEQIQMNLDAITAAMKIVDLEELGRQAHSVKGMGGTAGLPELSVLAEELEKAVKIGKVERVAALATALEKWFKQFIASR